MPILVDGDWRPTDSLTQGDNGEYERQPTTFRDRLGTDQFPAEAGRYHLYIARACPWAHGAVLVRSLMGLEDAITMDVVDPIRIDNGWEFSPEKDGCTPDTQRGSEYLREIYTAADPDYTGRVTVPVLWDTHHETIVNNESIEIMRMLATEMADVGDGSVDLYPETHRDEIDRVVSAMYDPINNGVYRAGFAKTQEAYETAATELFTALDHWEDVLEDQRYLAGDRLTIADLRLFATLVRFDHVYHTHFKCNRRRIVDYPNLWNFTKEVYQLPGVGETVNMAHITAHYYQTHTSINPTQIVPLGPDISFTDPHDRDRLPATTPVHT
ncbi:MAG: glutathione S-transferase family protein [Halobacteriales archaeon]|nr:glutathione S-transferase family protein [Halobacteriales archaeon]